MAGQPDENLIPSRIIQGVYKRQLRAFSDERGRFMETFRIEWFPHVDWSCIQSNRSDSKAGVIRGLHYHFNQIDYWYVPEGTIRAAMVDLRPSSPTYNAKLTVDIGPDNPIGLFIPSGVAHGFAALTDATMIYIVNNYYDGSDEFGVAWDEPIFNIDWGITDPIVSDRDRQNPYLKDIPADILPE